MGYNPQESLENTINTMGTRTLGVHPIGTWKKVPVTLRLFDFPMAFGGPHHAESS